MKILQVDAILIKKSLSVKGVWSTKGCWANFPTMVGNLEASTVCWREYTRLEQLSGY